MFGNKIVLIIDFNFCLFLQQIENNIFNLSLLNCKDYLQSQKMKVIQFGFVFEYNYCLSSGSFKNYFLVFLHYFYIYNIRVFII
jgi:hypothetical protein